MVFVVPNVPNIVPNVVPNGNILAQSLIKVTWQPYSSLLLSSCSGNFAKFPGNILGEVYLKSPVGKQEGLRPLNLLKNRLCFGCFLEIMQNLQFSYFEEHM